MEMTLRHLTTGDAIDHQDFLDRADTLGALGKSVLISNFRRFHRLASYLCRYTTRPLGIAIGASKLKEIFDESFYNEDEGGLLGGLGQLFKNKSRVYVYPSLDFATGEIVTLDNFPIPNSQQRLYEHLRHNHNLRLLTPANDAFLRIRSHDVLEQIKRGDPAWEQQLPPTLVEIIKAKRLFGCGG
jgi:hypothetical protein